MDSNKNYIKNLLPKRDENSHKGTFGHVLNIAGSEFYSGAAYFSSIASLKVGAGRCTLASGKETLQAVASLCPDVIFMPIENLKGEDINGFDSISIGCGLSQSFEGVKIFKKVIKMLENSQPPVVIDADGLNILASCHLKASTVSLNKECLSEQSSTQIQLPPNTILTPHPKEMSRLMDVETEEILKTPGHWVKECAKKYHCTAVLKLHRTLIADNQGNFYRNDTGNSALAKGGSGDVLTGIITGFLSQGLKPFEASCLGVYLHGIAGELAGKELTEYSVLASDLIEYIPDSIKTILA